MILAAGVQGASLTAPFGSGAGGSLTGSVWFPGPFTVSGTNWYLSSVISNYAVAPAFTNASQVWSNVIVVNPTANVLTNGILLTNAVKLAGTLASASRPMLVRIMPGTYGTPTNTLPSVMWAVDNVSTYWEPGSVWWSGTAGGDAAWMFDDQTAARTNCHVMGRGRFFITNDSINVFYIDKESRVRFECLSMYVTDGVGGNSTASPFTWGSVTNDMDVVVHDYMQSDDYDAFYGALAAGQRLRLKARNVRALGDIFEFADDSPQWGNVILDIDRAEQTSTSGQASFLQMAGRVHARIGQIKVTSTVSAMAANGSTNGILEGAIIELPANGTRSVIQDNSGGSWHTGLWLRDCVLIGPTNVDALTLTNQATVPTILENTTIRPGWASTNWARGATPSSVKIMGGFALDPYKPLGSQVTVISTNYLPSIRNIGTFVQHGASYFSNEVNITGGNLAVNGYDLYSLGAYFDSFIATNILNMPNGAGPYSPGDGDIAFDNNYWGAGRGAIVTWDGTANVVIPAVLQSSTPSNGKVLTWNTGGTITWETPAGGGSGGTNFPNVNMLAGNTNAALSAGVEKSFYIYTNANMILNFALATPESGYRVATIATNTGATNYTITLYANSAATTFYEPAEKTNNTSWSVPAGGIDVSEFTYTAQGWVRTKAQSASVVLAVNTTYLTMTTGGVNNLTVTLSPAYIPQASSMVLSNLVGAPPPTNENSSALVISSGTLALEATSSLSNLVSSTINFNPNNVVSNLSSTLYTLSSITVVGANSNQTVRLGMTNAVDMLLSTNMTLTNFSGVAAGVYGTWTAFIKVTNSAGNVVVNYGNLGLENPGYGVAIGTNANAPMWTVLTNTKTYALTYVFRGTNGHVSISLWE